MCPKPSSENERVVTLLTSFPPYINLLSAIFFNYTEKHFKRYFTMRLVDLKKCFLDITIFSYPILGSSLEGTSGSVKIKVYNELGSMPSQ